MLLYLFLLLSHIIGLTAGDTISAGRDEVRGTEGQPVSLSCSYETQSQFPILHWYKQLSDAPQFLLFKGAKSKNETEFIQNNHYKSTTTKSSTDLVIENSTLADSALYYCALDGLGFLTFAKPIKLIVSPKDDAPVAPALFILRHRQPEGDSLKVDQRGPGVCLATHFRPKGGNLVLNEGQEAVNTASAVLSMETKTYYYAVFKNNIESCSLDRKSSKDETGEEFESIYPENAKVNFYLVLMNGVRVIFTKAVAFNTIMAIRAVIF